MKATCPNNSEHKRFIALCTITRVEDWVVDETGCPLNVSPNEPKNTEPDEPDYVDPERDWECAECGAKVEVEYADNEVYSTYCD